jgi:hypothetical protein
VIQTPASRNPRDFLKGFVIKCQNCSQFCDFSESSKQASEKAARIETLRNVLESLRNEDFARRLSSEALLSVFGMIKSNLHRIIPIVRLRNPSDIAVDAEWEHIEVVYQILETVLQSTSIRLALLQSQVNDFLVNVLFNNAVAPDVRESRAACNCLSHIARRYLTLRKTLVSKSMFFLLIAMDKSQCEKALPAFLSFLGDSCDVLKFPELRKFCARVLFPLMTHAGLADYHSELCQFIDGLLSKEPQMLPFFVRYLLGHWPVQEPKKQSLFLDVLRDLIVNYGKQMPRDLLRLCIIKVASLFGDCLPDLARQSLTVFSDPEVIGLLGKLPTQVAKEVYNRAREVSDGHWSDVARWAADEVVHGIYGACLRQKEEVVEAPKNSLTWAMIQLVGSPSL